MSIDIKSFWQAALLLVAMLLVAMLLSQASLAQSGPDAFNLSNLPVTEQVQVVEQAVIGSMNADASGGLILADRMALEYRIAQQRYRFYEVILLSFVAVITLMIVLWFMRDNPKCQPRDMVNSTGLILVIFSTIIVILLADVEVQLTAAMGVLGGIAGYLFGTINAPGANRRTSENESDGEKKTKADISKS
jgi:hypothetical protein